MKTNYRAEVDGLRALAIVPVVLFHAGVPGFSGGFVGVDVFFVISGFLITSQIMRWERDSVFSVLEFYDRRIRRILPALFLICLVTLAVGWFVFLPKDLDDLGQGTVAASAFASNILFYIKTGYFEGASETKPLLHTWSLAVEEQFYVFFPLMVIGARRYWTVWKALALVALLSFAASAWGAFFAPSFAFYMLPTRAWELMAGCLLALRGSSSPAKYSEGASLLGVAAILLSAAGYSSSMVFPGVSALLPVLGAVLVLYGGASSAVGKLLSLKPVVFIGLISYSLYLWHWPVLVFARYLSIDPLMPIEIFACLALSAFLSILSWRYVERPIRSVRGIPSIRVIITGLAAMAVPAVFGFAVHYMDGIPRRLPADVVSIANVSSERSSEACPKVGTVRSGWVCDVGSSDGKIDFVLWGDSHAGVWFEGLDQVAKAHGKRGKIFTANGCPPVMLDIRGHYNDCLAFSKLVTEFISGHGVKQVFLSARWSIYASSSKFIGQSFADALGDTVASLREQHVDTLLLADVPTFDLSPPSAVARSVWYNKPIDLDLSLEGYEQSQGEANRLLADIAARYDGAKFVAAWEQFCGSGATCPVSREGQLLYRDDSHLSSFGAITFAPEVFGPLL